MRRLVVVFLGLLALFITACVPGQDGYKNPFDAPTPVPTAAPTAQPAAPAPTQAPAQPAVPAPTSAPVPPIAAPTAAPAAPTSAPQGSTCLERTIPREGKVRVEAGCVISGDVAWSTSENGAFSPLYDNRQETGLVVVVRTPEWVLAPFGASIHAASAEAVAAVVKASGCGSPSGCAVVNTVAIP